MSKMMGRGALAILAPLYEDVSHAGAIVSVQHDALSGHWAQHPALLCPISVGHALLLNDGHRSRHQVPLGRSL